VQDILVPLEANVGIAGPSATPPPTPMRLIGDPDEAKDEAKKRAGAIRDRAAVKG
jgi:hypothetical protein